MSSRARKSAIPSKLAEANKTHIIEAGFADDGAHRQHDREHGHGARAPPVRLLDKSEVCAIANVTFPTIWAWMRAGKFPRGRIVGGKTMWHSTEIDRWLADLPVRVLKGDTP